MIPKRALGAMIGTVLALGLLLDFRTPSTPTLASADGLDTSSGTVSAVVDTATPGASATADPTTTVDPTATPDLTASTSGYVDGTYTGGVASTRFGDTQVEVTISGGVIVDVTALRLPSGDRRTNEISSQVEPWLRESALVAQSAEIDLISGATYTSRSYAESLQSALDAAGG